jgi:lipopolysaccharide transport system ATP-binding protein
MFRMKGHTEISEGEFWALKGVDLFVRRGECIGLYGHNGAGKSTLLKLIASVTFPTRGTVAVRGRVAPLIEIGAGFHPDLTGRENIFMNGAIIGMRLEEIRTKCEDIIGFAELADFIDMPIKKYSSGMYLRLGFSIAIHSSAEILLLDEILAVGDEAFQEKCIAKIKSIGQQGRTMIIISHDRHLLEQVVDRIVFFSHGERAGETILH